MTATSSKVTTSHLERDAYLYIRQSTLRQVIENTESTQRQYALRQHAVALGWPSNRIIVIDSDLGHSGASAADREGFQRLVGEVGMGRAGIVLGLEVSRLARNSSDWHRLLEICALTNTLILDEDGLYDPAHFNDRLLLGLKGTMSEAELHLLRARLIGGRCSKARRGELRFRLPVGFVYDASGKVVLDPDRQVQRTLRVFFETFQRVGSCFATVRFFRNRSLLFPRRLPGGPNKGELLWSPLGYSRALTVLHNPRYAGAYAFGQGRWHKKPNGRFAKRKLPREEWFALHREAHPGYISWEQYERNEQRLLECAQAHGENRRRSPPREGPALLQGVVVCGICGDRMTIRYHGHGHARLAPDYVCQRRGIERAEPICQTMAGTEIDSAVGELLLATVSPMALEVTLAVQREIQERIEDADHLRRQEMERAELEVEQARRRYMHVDPSNRLVADSLEADWNQKLRAFEQARTLYEQQRAADRAAIDASERERILALAQDFPAVWRDPKTPQRERKRMVRLMLEDVTLIKAERITAHVRFRGGATTTLTLPLPMGYFRKRKTRPEVVEMLDELLQSHTESEAADILNQRGVHSGDGHAMNVVRVAFIRKTYGLKSLRDRLHDAGLLTAEELARKLDVAPPALKRWRKRGLLRGRVFNDKGEYMYEDPSGDPAVRAAGRHAHRVRPCAPGTIGFRVGGAV
jgi:DNA invertase Pin-like site-specific DNA recombinase